MNFSENITRSFGRGKLVLSKYSPEILLGVGIIGGVVAAVMAAKATRNLDQILEDKNVTMAQINDLTPDDATQQEIVKAKAMVFANTGLELAKLYGPSVGLGVLSVAAILASHGVMANRQVAVIAAYNVVSKTLEEYRHRVSDELGEEADKMFLHGVVESEEKELDEETGKKVTRKVFKVDDNYKSVYAVYFDNSSSQFRDDHLLNLAFVQHQQNYANDRLRIEGILFLNDVYRALGLPITKAGQVVGWKYTRDEEGNETQIDFGLMNLENRSGRSISRVNPAISLDFNVQGIVFDLI